MSAASTSMGYSAFTDKDLDKCVTQDTESKNDLKLFKQNILQEDAIRLSLSPILTKTPTTVSQIVVLNNTLMNSGSKKSPI